MVTHLKHHALLLTIVLALAAATEETNGLLAPISIASLSTYATARPCAAGCIVYNGIWSCGYNAGYNDLALGLGCGCSPVNACFCSDGYKSSATSYINSCISAHCGDLGNVDTDVTSMLELYNGYCATAKIMSSNDATTTNPSIRVPTSADSTSQGGSTLSDTAASATKLTDDPSTTTSAVSEQHEEGLGRSDVIAIATGLGVGIPSLLVAVVALWIQIRKRRSMQGLKTPSTSQTNLVPAPFPPYIHPQHPGAYELDTRGQRGWYI